MPQVLRYKKGYKYQLADTILCATEILGYDINIGFIMLKPDGTLILVKGFAWDGASGPAIDTDTFIKGSAAHDALYELMRLGYLPVSFRAYADRLLKEICLESGMWKTRANWVFWAVKNFAARQVESKSRRKIYEVE